MKENGPIIIGAGFSGLSAALRLCKEGLKPLIIEKDRIVGGMASCHRIRGVRGFWIEKFYHHFFTHDTEILALVKELGTEDRLTWTATDMGFYTGGRLYSLTTPFDLFKFGPLSFLERISFAIFSYKTKKSADNELLHDTSTDEWLSSGIGAQAYGKMMAPLIKSKFGVRMDEISAAFLRGRVKARVKSRKSLFAKEEFGYYTGGLQELADLTVKQIQKLGGRIELGVKVTDITREDDGTFTVSTSKGARLRSNKVIATTAVPILNSLALTRMSKGSPLTNFRYRGAVCMVVGLKRSITPYYWINIASDKLPFGIIIEHTNLVGRDRYDGDHIIYLSAYTDTNSRLFTMPDKELFSHYIEGLREAFPEFSPDDVLWYKVHREPFATPVFVKSFNRLLEDFKKGLPRGLHVAGHLLTYPKSRNINNALRTGRLAAEEILREEGRLKEGGF